MRHPVVLFIISAILLILAGCGNSETARLKAENDEQRQKISALEKEIASLKTAARSTSAPGAATPSGTAAPAVDNSSGEFIISYSGEQNSALNRFFDSNKDISLIRDSEKLRKIRKEMEKRLSLKNIPLTACWGDFTGDGRVDISLILKNSQTGKYSVAVFNGSASGGYDDPLIIAKDMERCDYLLAIPPDKSFDKPVIHIQEIDSSGAWSEYYWDREEKRYTARERTDSD